MMRRSEERSPPFGFFVLRFDCFLDKFKEFCLQRLACKTQFCAINSGIPDTGVIRFCRIKSSVQGNCRGESPQCVLIQPNISNLYLDYKRRYSHLHRLAGVVATEPNFELWTFFVPLCGWCSDTQNVIFYLEILPKIATSCILTCLHLWLPGKSYPGNQTVKFTKCFQRSFICEPNIKALSQLEAEIQTIARIATVEPNLTGCCGKACPTTNLQKPKSNLKQLSFIFIKYQSCILIRS